MLEPVVELLDRQFAFLGRQTGADFIWQLPQLLEVLDGEPRLANHLADIRDETMAFLKRKLDDDGAFVEQAAGLRDQLALRAAEVDDSDMERPAPGHGDLQYRFSFAHFDLVASGEDSPVRGIPLERTGFEDDSRSGLLVAILKAKLTHLRTGVDMETGGGVPDQHQRPDLMDLERRVGNLERAQHHWHRGLIARQRILPGAALVALEHTVELANPTPTVIVSEDDFDAFANQMFVMAVEGVVPLLDKALFRGGLSAQEQSQFELLIVRLRAHGERLYEDLRRRIGTVRSHRALVQRFKNRCEWHDRDRLRALATDSSTPEDDLAAEFARWLFDQGLSPLTKARTGGLEPDILDPSLKPTVYVEAKRYRSSSHARGDIRNGVQQVHDTVARLLGTPYEVDEAFLVVFREAGPRYALPESIPGEAWTVYPVLIDIAPAESSGSRQRERVVVLSSDEFSATA